MRRTSTNTVLPGSPNRTGEDQSSTWPARRGRWVLSATLGCLATALTLASCSGQHLKDPDGDGTRDTARPFSRLGPTEDELNVGIGDREDWRFILPERAGRMEMRISVGKWKESSIAGHVTIFTEVGDRIAEKAMPEGSGTLKFRFEVEPDMRYLVRFRASKGRGQYAVEVDFSGGCDSCSSKQDCVDGKCVTRACPGGCPSGQSCDRAQNRCVRDSGQTPAATNRCSGVHCPAGQTCSRSTGECVDRAPRCPAGTVRRGSSCVDKVDNITCTVVDARAAGSGSLLTLSAGDNKKVKVGATGTINGVAGSAFKVIAVYPSRCKAKCQAPLAKILSGGAKTATIKP